MELGERAGVRWRSAAHFISRRCEPVKAVAGGQRQENLILQIRQIKNGRVRHVRPIRRGQIEILLQDEIG
jgi:hypothetical protein